MNMKTPKRIVINDGELQMADGSSLVAYLRKWQKDQNVKSGTFVNIAIRDNQIALESDAMLGRNWGA